MSCKVVSPGSVVAPPGGIGGFAIAQPDLNIPFPDLPQIDLNDLFNTLSFILPPGVIKPHFEPDFLNDTLGGITSILEKFMPFLMLYKMFLPVLNLILCIIEVLCAIANPFALISAIRKLFRTCIPQFLSIFPFFALVVMIISLLLLILTLIEYLIQRIASIIEVILANIKLLSNSVSRADNDSIIAITRKIGDLLCSLQNLFVVFGVIAIIIQLIEAMLKLTFNIPPCDDGSDSGCCSPTTCPDFIKNNDTIDGYTGNLLYFNAVGIDSGLTLPFGFPPITSDIRNESWQFYDANLDKQQAFINITNAYDLPSGTTKIFFPGGTNYTKTTPSSSVPYTIDLRLFYNPVAFGRADKKGPRFIKIVNSIVQGPPTSGVSSYNNSFVGPFNGTLNLVGGIVQEDDGSNISGTGAITYMNDFIHNPTYVIPVSAGSFYPNDGYLFSDITYKFSINHEVLLGASLITLGCIPEVAVDKNFINGTIGAQFNANGAKLINVAGLLPDVSAIQQCIVDATTKYRQNISVETTNQFQTDINNCLNILKTQTGTALTAAIIAGFDQYKSDFSLDTNIQFTTLPIQVSVSINESSGQPITANLPASSASDIASQINGVISFGTLSNFTYDGYGAFVANITSKDAGNGDIKISFDNNFISIMNNSTDFTKSPSVSIKDLTYTFVKSSALGISGEPRRDAGDVSRDGAE